MSKTMKEMSEIKLEATKYLISTFKDLLDFMKLKKWVDEEYKNYSDLIEHIDKMRMLSLLYGKPELFEKWKKDNQMSFMEFKTLNKLRDDLHLKFCLGCGEPMKFHRIDKLYCGDTCTKRAWRKRERLKQSTLLAEKKLPLDK